MTAGPLTGLYNAGRAVERLDRDLTSAEWGWFRIGWVPATVKQYD